VDRTGRYLAIAKVWDHSRLTSPCNVF